LAQEERVSVKQSVILSQIFQFDGTFSGLTEKRRVNDCGLANADAVLSQFES